MKGLYLSFVIISLAAAHTSKKSNCVRYIDCPTEDSTEVMFMNDPKNCHNFYKCTKMICPIECPNRGNGNRLVWNSKENVCDWSFNVPNLTNCPDINNPSTSSPPTSSSSTPSSSTPSSSTPSSLTPSSSTPSSSTLSSSTPSSSTPSSSTPSSSTPSSSTPSSSTPSSSTPSSSTPSTSKCPKNGRKSIPHETNCNLYYLCINGEKTLKKCLEGHIFNPLIENCDLPNHYPPCQKIIYPRKLFHF
ncbi:cell wall integrity and stress response component 1 [Apis mellifera]|uniref:Cell wall integrity and stress response component 1 n=1 Tax=Apis mellifera TaxID=7460 RepID=A0A7M7LK58_APIME|nr:cell wall integrity and stress response component 1 [Apis mellifera]|eukprot:XP_003250137.2 cell wall integrity and stress response component 1 [Apis mellifera]